MAKKKILFLITQSEYGGAQRYCLDLARGLKSDFDFSIAAGGCGELSRRAEEAGVAYFKIPHLKREISPLNDFLAIFEIIKLISKTKPDIIHLNSSKISILGSLAYFFSKFRYQNLKLIYTAHGWVINEPLSRFKKLFYECAEKFTSIFKAKIICVSEFDFKTALKYKIAPEKKLIIIHNGIGVVDFYSKNKARKILNLPENRLIIGSIGNLYKTKGYNYLLDAVSHFQIPTIIIGEGEERNSLEARIKNLNLSSSASLMGGIENAAKLLPAFDLYACSSVKEGLSYTLIEAMQAGLPIVATEAGGNKELIVNNQTGLIAKTGNSEDLAHKIEILVNNPKMSKQLAENAKKKAENEFSLRQMLENTKNIYLNI